MLAVYLGLWVCTLDIKVRWILTANITYYLLKPDYHFLLTNHRGEVIVKDKLQTYTKYILYCYSRDNGDPNLLTP